MYSGWDSNDGGDKFPWFTLRFERETEVLGLVLCFGVTDASAEYEHNKWQVRVSRHMTHLSADMTCAEC